MPNKQNKEVSQIGVGAEYDAAKVILMHTPGEELFFGSLQGIAALFEDKPIDRYKIANEHKNYIATLESQGIEVLTVKDVLLQGTLDDTGGKLAGKELDSLVDFAFQSLSVSYDIDLPLETLAEMKQYKLDTLKALHPKDLVKVILEKPKVEITTSNEGNTDLIAKNYSCQPLMNIHFLRDQQITTDKGIVIGKMNSTQRRAETEVTKYVFQKLGIEPVYEIQGDGRLEGGDFIPVGDYAMIGQGLRTNKEGIKQLLNSGALGYSEVAVVKDEWKDQSEMHLDTYFNIAGSNKAVILEDRVDHYESGVFVGANSEKQTTVDLYKRTDEGYVLSNSDIPFQDFLASKGYSVEDGSLITLTKEEQLNYGCNFLTIGENEVVAVKGVSEEYISKLEGIKVHEIEFKEFVKTYGAPHCATQVIYRK